MCVYIYILTESNSKTNRILCSESSQRLLVDQAPDVGLTCRGKIAVKGKGEMMVYWVDPPENLDTHAHKTALSHEQEGTQRRVGFVASQEQQQEHHNEPKVDEHLWRRELKSHLLQTMDSQQSEDEPPHHPDNNDNKKEKTHKVVVPHRKAESTVKPQPSSSEQPSKKKHAVGNKNVSMRRGRS